MTGERLVRAKGVDLCLETFGEWTDPAILLVAGANEIPGARLLPLEQTGHALPRAVWDVVVPAILRHSDVERESR